MSLDKITCGASTTTDLLKTVNGLVDFSGQITTQELINSSLDGLEVGDTVATSGFYASGDNGSASWYLTEEVTTPSSTPIDTSNIKLSDALGRVFTLAEKNATELQLGFSDDLTELLPIAVNFLNTLTITQEAYANLSANDVYGVTKYIGNLKLNHELNINLPPGEIPMQDFVDINSPSATYINLIGTRFDDIQVTSFNSVSGSAKGYSVSLGLSDASDIELGDVLQIVGQSLSGTGDFEDIAGSWIVESVSSGEATVRHTHHAASFPAMTISGGTVRIIKSRLKWPSGCRGLSIYNCDLKSLSNLVLQGDFDISTDLPSDGPNDGLCIGDSANESDTGSSLSRSVYTGSVYLFRVSVINWENNGLQVIGGSVSSNGTSFCSNGHRGAQSAGCGSVQLKLSSSCGNSSSGYEAEGSGFLNAAGAYSIGNGEQGVYTIGVGNIVFNSGAVSSGNSTHGLDARDSGNISANTSTAKNNGVTAIKSDGGYITLSNGNYIGDVVSDNGGYIDLSSSTGTGSLNCSDGSIKNVDGEIIRQDWITSTTPIALNNVTYTDDGSSCTYIVSGGMIYFKMNVKYTGLNTSDSSGAIISGLPRPMSGRVGGLTLSLIQSDGLSMDYTNFVNLEYNNLTDSIAFASPDGGKSAYNSGIFNTAGSIVLSGWYEPSY